MRTALLIILLAILPLNFLMAQEEAATSIITEVNFEGLNNVTSNQLLRVYRPYIGQVYRESLVDELINRLYALEYFNVISPRVETNLDGTVIYLDVEERPKIMSISYQGVTPSLRSSLDEAVLIGTVDDYYYEGILAIEEQNILDFYSSKGFIDTTVTSRIEEKADNGVDVIFNITEGIRLRIREITYEGNSDFSEAQLRAIPGLKLTGLALLFSSDYKANDIQEDRDRIELYYKKNGYIDVKIPEIREDILEEQTPPNSPPSRYLRLVFVIEEGQQYTFGNISLEGNILFSNEEILKLFLIKEGETFDFISFQNSFEAVRSLYYDIGYVNNTIEYLEDKNSASGFVSYTINIIERERALVEEIVIQGNTVTDEDIIRREIELRPGDVFSRQELLRSISRLQYLEIFESVTPQIQPGSAANLLRIIIQVTEGKTVAVQGSVGFSPSSETSSGISDFPFTIGADVYDKNFLGRNYFASLKGELGAAEQSGSVNFINPRLFGSLWSWSAGLAVTHSSNLLIGQDLDGNGVIDPYLSDDDYQSSGTNELANNLLLYGNRIDAFTLSPRTSLGYTWFLPIGLQLARLRLRGNYAVNLEYLDYDKNVVRPLDTRQRAGHQRFLYGDVFGTRISFSTLDVPTNPTSGILASQALNLGGFIPTDFNRYYLTSLSRFDFHIPIFDEPVSDNWNFTLVFSFHTGLSTLFKNPFRPEELNARENGFFISSFTIGRGWQSDFGEMLWESSLTLSWLLVPQVINLELFFDAIGLWREKELISKTNLDHFRFSLGFGPRLTLAQLPLGFYFIKLFRTRNGTIDWEPEPGIGEGWNFALQFKIDIY